MLKVTILRFLFLLKTVSIDNIYFILGAKSNYCLPENEILFGKSECSLYDDTSLGEI